MKIKVVGSGSSGNCYLVEDEDNILILDAGIPVKKIVSAIDLGKNVSAVLVTHEHMDHAKSMIQLSDRGIRVFASAGTWEAVAGIDNPRTWTQRTCVAKKRFKVDGFIIIPFDVQHDAEEPYGYYIISDRTNETIVYATDTYYLKYTFPAVNYWLIECNYAVDLVNDQFSGGEIGIDLRNRLMKSHMSLERLKDVLRANDLSETRALILCHLSDQRSDQDRMIKEINELCGVDTYVADAGAEFTLSLCPF